MPIASSFSSAARSSNPAATKNSSSSKVCITRCGVSRSVNELLDRFNSLQQLRQAFEHRGAFQPELVVDGGIAGNNLVGFDGIRNSGLRRGDDAIPDFQMPRDAHLSGEDHIPADSGAAGQTDL